MYGPELDSTIGCLAILAVLGSLVMTIPQVRVSERLGKRQQLKHACNITQPARPGRENKG